MEDKLKESERRFNELVHLLPVCIFEVSIMGNITYVNDVGCNMLGYVEEELLGRPFFQFIAPEDRNRCIVTIQNILAGRLPGDHEFAILKKDGTPIPTFIQSTLVKNSRGESIGVRGLLFKVTEDKNIEALIRASEDKYRTLVNNIKLGVNRATMGNNGRYLEVNKAMEEITGYSREELLSIKIADLYLNPNDRQELYKEIIQTRATINREVKLKKKDGAIIQASVSLTPIKDPQGAILYLDGVMEDITAHKQAEESLRKSEERFRLLAENAKDMIYRIHFSPRFEFEYVSPSATAITGYTPAEHMSDPFITLKIIHPDDRGIQQKIFNHEYDNIPVSFRWIRKDGQIIWIEQINIPIKDKDGSVVAVEGIARDITERKRVEEELTRNKRIFSLSVKLAQLGPWEFDDQKGVFIFNDEFYSIYGTSVEREGVFMTPEKYAREFIHPDDLIGSPLTQELEPTDFNSLRMEHRIIRRDGEVRFIAILSKVIKDNTGKVIEWYGANQDITEHKLMQESFKESEKIFHSLVDNLKVGVFRNTTDPKGKILELNRALEEITGYTRDELLNMNVVDLYVNPEERMVNLDRIAKLEKGVFEFALKKKDKTQRIVSVTLSTVNAENGKILYFDGIMEDITERKFAEEERKLAAEKLRELYKIEKLQRQELEEEAKTRGMFIDVLAHELRTPLTPIISSTGMLQELINAGSNTTQKKLILNIKSGAETLTRRLEELLDLARYSRGTFKLNRQPTEVKSYLEEVIFRFKPSIEQRNQHLRVEIAEDLPVVELDASRLEQVLVNLLSNAVKFSPEKGIIQFKAFRHDGWLEIEVKDEGIGIAPDDQKRLFQPYHRVEQDRYKYPGMGLGLAVSKQIVEAHGGTIWITSQLGQGSTFSFRIPL